MQAKPFLVDTKFNELLIQKIPKFERYIDLNFGNGEILFSLNTDKPCLINDTNATLIEFYSKLSEEDFILELESFSSAWSLLKQFSYYSADEIFITFQDLLKNIITVEDTEYIIRAIILMNIDDEKFSSLFNRNFLINLDLFTSSIIKSIVNEFKVIKGAFVSLNIDNLIITEEFKKSIESAFKQGFFNHFQNIINLQNTDFISVLNKDRIMALWYFLSQNCKGKFSFVEKESHKNKYNTDSKRENDLENMVDYFKTSEFNILNKNATYSALSVSDFLKSFESKKDDFICADFRSTGYFSENARDVSLKNEIAKTIEYLNNTEANWVLIFGSAKFTESIGNYVSLQTETIEIQGKTTIIAKSF